MEEHRSLHLSRNGLASGGNSDVLAVVPAVIQSGGAVCLLTDYQVSAIFHPYHKDIKHGDNDMLRTTIRGQDLTSPGPSIGHYQFVGECFVEENVFGLGEEKCYLGQYGDPQVCKLHQEITSHPVAGQLRESCVSEPLRGVERLISPRHVKF